MDKMASNSSKDSDDEFESMFDRPGPLLERKGVRSMNKFDPGQLIDKSVSESSLFKEAKSQKANKSVSYKASTISSENLEKNGTKGNKKVSESSKVYFDLSQSEESETAKMSMKSKGKDDGGKSILASASKSKIEMGQRSSIEAYKQVESSSKRALTGQSSELSESSTYTAAKSMRSSF